MYKPCFLPVFWRNTLRKHLQHLQDIILELRNIIVAVAPGVTEKGHSRGFSYYYKERGGPVSAGVCQIIIFEDHIRLAFIHGGFLPDPKHLLEGETLYKRNVRLYSLMRRRHGMT